MTLAALRNIGHRNVRESVDAETLWHLVQDSVLCLACVNMACGIQIRATRTGATFQPCVGRAADLMAGEKTWRVSNTRASRVGLLVGQPQRCLTL